ncbi:gamma-glutamylcyclotransferase [Paracoccaceae bacterium Fryx2]|nr:gamma-glutamylcyclotransferase [Paracoccaceae bacterium Fryx2]
MDDGVWVFGYGSLIWDPGFVPAATEVARLSGWHRSFCMWSVVYRGTQADPGLVLALDAAEDAQCDGLAFRIAGAEAAATLAALRARELISYAYRERELPVTLASGAEVTALAYVIDRDHAQYAGRLALEDQAAIIARCHGQRGPNRDYLFSTAAHLAALGMADADLDWLVARVRALQG